MHSPKPMSNNIISRTLTSLGTSLGIFVAKLPSYSQKWQAGKDMLLQQTQKIIVIIPYGWLLLFFVIPFVIVFKISIAEPLTAIPPYTALLQYKEDVFQVVVNYYNYLLIASDSLYYESYIRSLQIAATATIMTLLIGYPMAYAITNAKPSNQGVLLLLILLPSWTSFLIRIYAWVSILKNNGLINSALMSMGIIDDPLIILNTKLAVYIGIVYGYLPFMVLPIYANLNKMDKTLSEAAADLGCRGWQIFLRVTLPLSLSGIIAGCMLVFIPSVGEFVIPELLGGSSSLMIGKVLWTEFFGNRDWPVASALAVIMLLLLVIPIMIYHRFQSKALESS